MKPTYEELEQQLAESQSKLERIVAENAARKSEVPLGAIENGRAFADRLEAYPFECQGGNLSMCSDWQELIRCFEHLAEWAMHGQDETPATSAFLAEVRASGVDELNDTLCKLLPGCQYMDPPDGGSVTPLEQVSRMVAGYREQIQAAEKRIAELEASANASLKYASELESEIESMQRKEHHRGRQSVIDALATSGEAWSDIEEYMQKWDAERAAGISVKGE